MKTSRILLAALLVAPPLIFTAQQAAPDPAAIRVSTSEIVVDAVVRDKKGRIVRGLTGADLTVLEDGVEQQVTSWREVTAKAVEKKEVREVEIQTARQPGSAPIRVERQVRLVTLLFERLNQDGRRLARQAALAFLDADIGADVYIGVATIDRSFRILQPYTNRTDLLRKAVERATGGPAMDIANDNIAAEEMLARVSGSEGTQARLEASGGGGQPPVNSGGLSDEQAARMMRNMTEYASALTREEVGNSTIVSLWSVVSQLSALPGRKQVLYFSEGIYLPNSVWHKFQAMISAANRANVTVYPVDARGLRTASDQEASNAALKTATAKGWRSASGTETSGVETFRGFDMALDSLKGNVQESMRELAESTGGFLISNTNDFRPALKKLSEEFNTYYELTYKPQNPGYDGRFRVIQVKAKRNDLIIQARNGYFALPPMDGQAVFSYEVPLLNALGRKPLPKDLDFRAAVIPFRNVSGWMQAELVVDMPLRDVLFVREEKSKLVRTHLSMLALVKDEQGHVVAKLSRDVPLNQPPERVEQYKMGRFIVSRPLRLAPGRYTIEAVVADQEADRASAKRLALFVPAAKSGPAMSGMTLLRRMDKPVENPDPEDAYQLPQGRVIPTLITNVYRGKEAVLPVYFHIYPDANRPEKSQLVIDLMRDGKVVSRSRPELPVPNPQGAIPYLARVPLDSVEAGQYEFRATVIQGEVAAQQIMPITVE